MSVNGVAARRDMWTGRVERCLAADMTVKEWCALNKVAESSLYKWMARFREEDPGRFPRRLSEASSWMKVTRRGIADAPGGGVAVSDPPRPQGGSERAQGPAGAGAQMPIRALVGRVELAIPAGAAEADIAAAMRAAASLRTRSPRPTPYTYPKGLRTCAPAYSARPRSWRPTSGATRWTARCTAS